MVRILGATYQQHMGMFGRVLFFIWLIQDTHDDDGAHLFVFILALAFHEYSLFTT